MSVHFHKLTVAAVEQETTDCVSITFNIPEDLKKVFQYTQGQSLTMKNILNGEEVRRTYSLCSSPLDNEWKVAVKKADYGLFSTYANTELKAGDTLDVMEPVGKFNTELRQENKKHYLALAAGSGITPVLSIIKTTLRTEPHSRFTLVYGNRNHQSIIFLEELEGLKNKFLNRFTLIHVLSRERTDTSINNGRIDADKLIALEKLINYDGIDDVFICGPEALIFTARDFFLQKGFSKKQIHFELFSTQGKQKPEIEINQTEKNEHAAQSSITIKVDGRSFDFYIPQNSKLTILDAALAQGADLPFACKGGMCCTCKAKLIEGKVAMDVHWGLEDEEVDNGYILTCQSHPQTEKVVVDYDIK
ncbi:MAG TPA: phenylacetate-CoA oxygenase/reductase subunit PaaK [Chitinophagaceae bacterium]|jgi:ring-1,2-phenylacetyl-CoA epoxidase subunit PaaE|nr:phenylacetate-CoA oxygenase/reductase subunit PaaK [Chitinophagaceae bacterium]